MTTMTTGVDLHKRETQLCFLAPDGIATERRIVTSRKRFTAVFGAEPPARVLVEASTESEWVARHLDSLGHTVIVADPNYAPMYATRTRRVKTDKRDARARAGRGVPPGRVPAGAPALRRPAPCARGARGARRTRPDAHALHRARQGAGAA